MRKIHQTKHQAVYIEENATDLVGRPIPANYIQFWNNSTADNLEVERLRKQVDTLVAIQLQNQQLIKGIDLLSTKLQPIRENIIDLHKQFITPKDIKLTAAQKRKLKANNAIAKL
jgi:hypothetical protein